jgi:hypothetical protein
MFEFIKSLFGFKPNIQTPGPVFESHPVKKPAKKKTTEKAKSKKHTKASLGKLTKVKLEELGRAEFNVELDRRRKKDALISQLLDAQKAK